MKKKTKPTILAFLIITLILSALTSCDLNNNFTPATPTPDADQNIETNLLITACYSDLQNNKFVVLTNVSDKTINLGDYNFTSQEFFNKEKRSKTTLNLYGELRSGCSLILHNQGLDTSKYKDILSLPLLKNGSINTTCRLSMNLYFNGNDILNLSKGMTIIDTVAYGNSNCPIHDTFALRIFEDKPTQKTPWSFTNSRNITNEMINMIFTYDKESSNIPVTQFFADEYALNSNKKTVFNQIDPFNKRKISWISRNSDVTINGKTIKCKEIGVDKDITISSSGTDTKLSFGITHTAKGTNEEPVPFELPADASNKMKKNVQYGNPSWRFEDMLEKEEHFLIYKDAFVLSYNDYHYMPNWVSWHLEYDDTTGKGRVKDFHAEESLPPEWEKADHYDSQFSMANFDRGHMCPNADRDAIYNIKEQTYSMANIVMQSPANNQKAWMEHESSIRYNIGKTQEAYIISGPWGIGGESPNGHFDYIETKSPDSNNNPLDDCFEITVPEYTWKVVLYVDKGAEVTEETARAEAVWMPNDQTCTNSFTEYYCSVDFVEAMTGYDFFAELPDEIENKLESIGGIPKAFKNVI